MQKKASQKVIELNDKRRSAQTQLDNNLARGELHFQTYRFADERRKKEEAEAAKSVLLKSRKPAKAFRLKWAKLPKICKTCFIPSEYSHESVPEGNGAEDNVGKMGVWKPNLKDASPLGTGEKYDLIDFTWVLNHRADFLFIKDKVHVYSAL